METNIIDRDLSFSGIVNELQGDKTEAAILLTLIAEEKESNDQQIEFLEKKLSELKTRNNQLINASGYIIKHIEEKTPLYIPNKKYIVIVNKDNIKIEKNIL